MKNPSGGEKICILQQFSPIFTAKWFFPRCRVCLHQTHLHFFSKHRNSTTPLQAGPNRSIQLLENQIDERRCRFDKPSSPSPHSSFWFLWETFWGVFLCQSAASSIYQKLAWACDKVIVKFFTCSKVSTIPSPAPTRAVRWKINRKRFNLQKQCGVESIEIRRTNQFLS